jgi:hypothetical protein
VVRSRCPFDINPAALKADYNLWVCGTADNYYLIPYRIIRSIYDDPAAFHHKKYPDIVVVNVGLVSNLITYGRDKTIDARPFRNITLRELRARRQAVREERSRP